MSEDDEFWQEQEKETRWIARGDPSPVTHYEWLMANDEINRKLQLLRDKLDDIEERLVETRAKHFLMDLFVTGTGRFLLVAASLAAAFAASKLGYGPFG